MLGATAIPEANVSWIIEHRGAGSEYRQWVPDGVLCPIPLVLDGSQH